MPTIPLYQGLSKVISGGQTGVDQAALYAAKLSGIATGGLAPKGYRTTHGNAYHLIEFGVKEDTTSSYKYRTVKNVKNSNGTILVFIDLNSPGSQTTLRAIEAHNKPCLLINLAEFVNSPAMLKVITLRKSYQWLCDKGIQTLNIAGHSEETSPGITSYTMPILLALFKLHNKHHRHQNN